MSDLISRKALIESYCEENCGERRCRDAWDRCMFVSHVLEQPSVTDTNVGGKWIPCSERLPDKEYELYWTTHEDGSIVLHGYTKKNGFIYNWEVDDLELRKRQGGVVAWMLIPQPEPYKGE